MAPLVGALFFLVPTLPRGNAYLNRHYPQKKVEQFSEDGLKPRHFLSLKFNRRSINTLYQIHATRSLRQGYQSTGSVLTKTVSTSQSSNRSRVSTTAGRFIKDRSRRYGFPPARE